MTDAAAFPEPSTNRRTVAMVFLPFAILVAAAVITNFGGGVAPDAKAAAVNVSATILSNRAITNTCGTAGDTGPLSLGTTLAPNAPASGNCLITFGSTNSASTLNVAASATNLGFTGFTAMTATCAVPTAGQIGLATTTTGTAAETGGNHCATAGQVKVAPTTATSFCTAIAGPNLTCDLLVALNTGTVTAGTFSGTLTTSLT